MSIAHDHPKYGYSACNTAPLEPGLNQPFDNRYWVERHLDEATAEKIATRMLELGCDHAGTKLTRLPTPADCAALGRTSPDLKIIYVRGPVEDAFEAFGADPNFGLDRNLVDSFLLPMREARAAEALAARQVKWNADLDAFFSAHPMNPSIERAIRAECVFGTRGARLPAVANDSDWFKRTLAKTTDQWGKPLPAYVPEESGFALQVETVVIINSTQEAYADHSVSLIPVVATAPYIFEAAHRNLARIAQSLNTHTGLAGSGSTYTLSLVVDVDGAYVRLSARHSISD